MAGLKLYVACSLTGATDEELAEVYRFKAVLREAGYQVLDYFGGKGRTVEYEPCQIYDADIVEGVGGCDLLVAVMKGLSDGRGMEIGAALWRTPKPIVMVYINGDYFSSLLRDAANREPLIELFPCERTYDEVVARLPDLYAKIRSRA